MKKNRIYFGLLILALVVTIVWTSAGMLGVNKEEKKYSVSVIVNDSNNDRWIAMREGLEQAAKDDDIQLNYVSTGVFASEDEEKALIEREVENGADGIIVQLVSSEDTYAVFEKIDSSVAVMLLETDAVSEGVYSVTARIISGLVKHWHRQFCRIMGILYLRKKLEFSAETRISFPCSRGLAA